MPAPPDSQNQYPQDQPRHSCHAQRLTPTDMAQFLRLGECRRYLKMRQHEHRKGSGFLRKYGVAPQAIPPLLTLSGQRFERYIEDAARNRFKVIRCGDDAKDDYAADEVEGAEAPGGEAPPARVDNDLVAGLARALPRGGTLLLFQPRLEAALGDCHFTGDLDILRLDRDDQGRLSALIVDMKSTTKAKLEHRLQVAFYHNMLVSVLGDAGVAFARVDLGIAYRGPAHADGDTVTGEEMIQRAAAQTLLGVPDALLEVIADKDDYLAEVQEMVVGPESVVSRVAHTRFAETPFHLSYKCDGCLYQEWCMKAAFEGDDLSLIPTLTASEKRTLQATGLDTVADVAALMQITAEPGRKPRLVPAEGQGKVVRSLRASPLGARLPEIVHRAKSVSQSRRRALTKAVTRREEVSAKTSIEKGVTA